MLPSASKRGSSVTLESTTPTRAITRPISAPRSSSSTTGSSALLDRRTNANHDEPGSFTLRASRTAVRMDNASATSATVRIATAIPRFDVSCGWRSFSTPSNNANRPPAVNSTTDTTKAQK